MILYTMMPEELIFPTAETDFSKQKIVEMNGVSLLVNETSQNQYVILRVLSSDPQHFLDDQYSPGQKVTMSVN
ncbi:YlzJ-like family protein [Cytobacillus sp. S13-E01]|uniref:YlzJ-like family protein n=1 Tax=Cytobacillus sp. S13-E01 TaxID=3031326 RepID=UPI0023D7E754|nr:YlzJ-like family protein [Cytobacillus sp. S13-E01]MDF0725128.1 YlzJ-like family protein [Cytobacillus sp. S13-E01]